jgi:hypothetical protein
MGAPAGETGDTTLTLGTGLTDGGAISDVPQAEQKLASSRLFAEPASCVASSLIESQH